MKQTGSPKYVLLAALLLMVSASARGDLTASVDRDRISLGDTMQLTITATDNERLENLNLNPLVNDFQILARSTSSSTSIVNGRRTSTRQVIIDLVARWEGTIRIPPLSAGPDTSNYLLISVGPAQATPGADITLSFEAELDSSSVYVQGQAILTLRIQQAINLVSRNVTELQLDNAFVKQLEQESFQRTIDGQPWLIHEIRYAIFPEVSGKLEIPAQTFSARENGGRRGMLSLGGGRKLQRTTQALTLEVLPRPNSFKGATWLPAEQLNIEEVWSTPPEQLRVGESATRTIKIVAQGLQAAQLPPVDFPPIDGLKTYPDQAVTEDLESASGLSGSREDAVALIPTRAGQWTLPEVKIPWWDVTTKTLRHAVLPAREIVVARGENTVEPSFPIPLVAAMTNPISITPATPARTSGKNFWLYIALGLALGWFFTLLYIYFTRSTSPSIAIVSDEGNQASEKQCFNQLVVACGAQDPHAVRGALIHWTRSVSHNSKLHSLDDVAQYFQNVTLSKFLEELNSYLYNSGEGTWEAGQMAGLLATLRKKQRESQASSEPSLELYPRS